jgi:small-conductance mechanosensitive channel
LRTNEASATVPSSSATAASLRYAPRLFGAVALLLGTVALASFVRNLVEHAAGRRDDLESPQGAAKIAQALVLVVGSTLAAEQAGIEVSFLTVLFQLAVGLTGLAFALAFALGFSAVFRGMAARHYYRPLVRVGDVVRIGDDQGRVVRYGATAIVLATDDGERIVPCLRFLSNTVQVRPAADAAEEP